MNNGTDDKSTAEISDLHFAEFGDSHQQGGQDNGFLFESYGEKNDKN